MGSISQIFVTCRCYVLESSGKLFDTNRAETKINLFFCGEDVKNAESTNFSQHRIAISEYEFKTHTLGLL